MCRLEATAVHNRKGDWVMTDELIMPYKQALSNECHSRALDDDVLTVSVITNTVVPADHDIPIIQATIKELQMFHSLRLFAKQINFWIYQM